MPGLTPRQQRFVEEYVVDFNATQAYIRAGYAARGAEPNAHALIRNHKVAAAIAERKQAITERVEDTAAAVLQDAIRAFEAAMKARQYGPAVAALNLRAKRHSEFSEKREHAGPNGGPIPVVFASLSTDDLRALAEHARRNA